MMHAAQSATIFNSYYFLLLLFSTVDVHVHVDDISSHSSTNNVTDQLIVLLNSNGSNDDSAIINGSNISLGLC